jgi:hypothetical protein
MNELQYFGRISTPTIYAYTTPQYQDKEWEGAKSGKGLLKIGYTERDAETRIWEQFPTNAPDKSPFTILINEPALDSEGKFFSDHSIHAVLTRNGFYRYANTEWFECAVADVKSAILELKLGQKIEGGRHENFAMRPEQLEAISQTETYYQQYQSAGNTKASHFLWNAKMRFGKTFTAYQLAKKMGWKRVMVLTYKPAVQDAWREDLENHVDFEGWQFIGRGETMDASVDESKPIVWFASFQDILGKTKTGQIKSRFEVAHAEQWDCVILDEYHFGAWRDSAKDLYDAEQSEQVDDLDFSEETFPLNVNHFLYLSGTPFRALGSGEFLEDQIYNWTYADEQRAKEAWLENNLPPNPYEELAQIVMMTYQIPEAIREVALRGELNEFDLNEFFKAKETADGFIFEHQVEVQKWLSLIRGQYVPSNTADIMNATKPPIPFEDVRLLRYLNHTFWFLPSVAACKAMAQALHNPENKFFHEYKVIVAAGIEAGVGLDAIKPVRDAMGNPLKTKTITLSCGKLTTGVSIPGWSGIFMLRNTSSPESYFQAAFRIQTPWYVRNKDGTDPHAKEVLKPKCYIFDFAPNRALQLISEYSSRLDLNESTSVESKVEDFIRFLPVLCYDGFTMQPLDARSLLDIVAAGTASTMLAKRWQSAQMVNVDNMTLEKLLNNPDILAALEDIEAFRSLGKDISKVISSEKALNKLKKAEKEGEELTPKEKKELKDGEKENRGFKKELREKLLKFVTRVPIFMYLTDNREESLKDVITELEPALFTKVTGLKVTDFEKLCEIGVFNPQVMNSAIFAFKRFEESSLTYAGGKTLSEMVGGFDTTISRDELTLVLEGIS